MIAFFGDLAPGQPGAERARGLALALAATHRVAVVAQSPLAADDALAPLQRSASELSGEDARVVCGQAPDAASCGGARAVLFDAVGTRLPAAQVHAVRQARWVVVASRWARDVLQLAGLPAASIIVIPSGFDATQFVPRSESRRWQDGEFRVLAFVGADDEAAEQVCGAWNTLFGSDMSKQLVLWTGTDRLPATPAGNVRSQPWPATADARAAALATRDAALYIDRADATAGFLLEAMACKVPVIGLAQGAAADLLDAASGWAIPATRWVPAAHGQGVWPAVAEEDIVAALRALHADFDLAQRRAAHAVARAHAAHSWPLVAAQFASRLLTAAAARSEPLTAPVSPALPLGELMARVDACATDLPRAIGLYRDWLSGGPKPLQHVARFNLAHLLSQSGALAEAESHYRSALAEAPGFVQAWLNLGSVLERQSRIEEALGAWRQALALAEVQAQPDVAMQTHALNHLGRVLEQQHRYDEAEAMLARSLAVKPTQDDVLHHWVHLRQKQCHWPVFDPLPGIDIATQRRAASALAMLSASDDPAEQLDTARRFAAAKIPADLPPLAPSGGYRHERVRIGYLSSNLNLHAVTILTAEVYELHDRSRFEVYGFCWSPEDGTPMRARIRRAMDHLVRIDQLSDEAAAQAIRDAEIDVLIDLQGLTSGCRPRILAHRPAPVQVSWLGFPGTSAIPGVDYILADHYLIPETERVNYSETPIYLPECFQSNDRQRAVAPAPTRAECGLPDEAMVFCAFNHNHKFNPEVFGLWMDILSAVPASVLWLLADNPPAQRNLTAFAQARGVAAERLIFAPRVVPERYLARFKAADLFLDTLPFNGGTTVSDALWAGLPVLTRSGRTFAGRMAGSLLHAAGLPELVTDTPAQYRELAIALAADRPRLRALRDRLAAERDRCALFDTPRLVRHLESALAERVHLCQAA